MKKMRNHQKVNAFFTIEASVIIPITFLLIAAVIFLTFYAHDAVTVKAMLYESLITNAEAVKNGETPEADLNGVIAQRLLFMKSAQFSFDTQKERLEAGGKGEFYYPFSFVKSVLGPERRSFQAEYVLEHPDARGELLGYQAVLSGLEKTGFVGNGEWN